jgi:acyl dehydratase
VAARPRLTEGEELAPYRVRAHNTSTASENKIHDDEVAKRYGFRGGLVPGVVVYAYMSHPVVEAFGIEWLGRGSMQARFVRPFYDGETVTVRTRVSEASAEGTRLTLEAANDSGEVCATGSAFLPKGACGAPPSLASYPEADLPGERPAAVPEVMRGIDVLGTPEIHFDAGERARQYLADIGETLPLFEERRIAHPGWLVRLGNTILASNVLLGPWIHVESEVQHYSLVRDGESVAARGRVREVFERKGHQFAALDVLVVANGERPVMHILHTAIYQVRKAG